MHLQIFSLRGFEGELLPRIRRELLRVGGHGARGCGLRIGGRRAAGCGFRIGAHCAAGCGLRWRVRSPAARSRGGVMAHTRRIIVLCSGASPRRGNVMPCNSILRRHSCGTVRCGKIPRGHVRCGIVWRRHARSRKVPAGR